MITLIWAMDKNRGIGINNKIPWDCKEDLKHFFNTTQNGVILMGNKTFSHLPKKLLKRYIYVLTKNKKLKSKNPMIKYIYSISEILKTFLNNKQNNIFICGGSSIYKLFLNYADKLIISFINGYFLSDSFFPKLDLSEFVLKRKIKYINFEVQYYDKKEI